MLRITSCSQQPMSWNSYKVTICVRPPAPWVRGGLVATASCDCGHRQEVMQGQHVVPCLLQGAQRAALSQTQAELHAQRLHLLHRLP